MRGGDKTNNLNITTMKKVLLAIVICTLCVSCHRNTYNINGTYTAPDGTDIYLINLDNKDTISVTAVKDNRFLFKGKLHQPIYAYIGQGRERIYHILEPGTVTADIDNRTGGGTPMVETYLRFHRRFYGYDAQRNNERKVLTAEKETISLNEFNQRWEAINDKYRVLQGQLTDSLVSINKDNLVGALALDDMAFRDTTLFMRLYNEMSPQMQTFSLLRSDAENIRLQSRTAPGKMFTDYLIKGGNPDGSDVRLSDYVGKGKYILLDHWASWCGPCKAEMPYLKKTWTDFAGDRFDIVSVAVNDKREQTLQALRQLDMPWHQILDAQNIPSTLYNIKGIPHLILFAPDGTILRRDLRGEQIYTAISQILSEEK